MKDPTRLFSEFSQKEIVRAFGVMALGLSASLTPPLSHAQSAGAAAPVQQTEEVVISASRIARSGFTAPTPTTIVGTDDFAARATTTIAGMLAELPSVRPTSVPAGNAQATGLSAINLRNLGNNRTLILVDGHRFVPTNVNGVVDSNVLPNALMDRVEVVTGGASAAWGSDAVAGVVNFIFKKRLEGFQGNIQYGESQRGDEKNTSASLAWGTGFADNRGQFMIAAEYNKTSDPQKFTDRDWSNHRTAFVPGTVNGAAVTNTLVNGATLANLTSGGVIIGLPATSPLRGIQFGPGGVPQPFSYGTNINGNFMVGGSGGWFIDQFSWHPDLTRKNVYARATYDFTDSLRGYAELSSMQTHANETAFTISVPNIRGSLVVRNDNAFLPASVKSIMTSSNIASFTMGRIFDDLCIQRFDTKNKTNRFVVGLDGSLGEDYQWKAYITRGKTRVDTQVNNHLNVQNLAAAIDAVVDTSGNIVCRAATVASVGAAPGCVPLNPFGPNSVSAAARSYVIGTQTNYYDIQQDAGALQLQGEPFSTWAGKVSLAGGIEYRKESIVGDSDAVSQTPMPAGNVAGLTGLGGWQFGNPQPISGAYTAKEWFAETVVPLLANAPLAKALDLNAAARNTDYSTSGNVTSSKVGLTYKPVDSLLMRATKSRDIRAPNLNELLQGGATGAFAVTDYGKLLANGQPDTYTTIQKAIGNLNLKPETANTKTIGIVLTPSFLSGFKASVDYYSIEITNAIASVTAQNLVNGCVGVQGFSLTPAFCSQLTRDPTTGRISQALTTNINFQKNSTKGVDYEASYRFSLANLISGTPGNVTLRVLASQLKTYVINNGITSIDRAGEIVGLGGGVSGVGTSLPKWRSTWGATYQNGPLTLFGQARSVGKGKYDVTATSAQIDNNDVPSRNYLDASVQYLLSDTGKTRIQVYGKVNNLLDRDPPILGPFNANVPPTNYYLYDTVGRSFVAGVRFEY